MMTAVHSAGSPRAFPINGVVLVGVCAAGKTTAREGLGATGIPARSVAQEHSMIKHLYRNGGPGRLVLLVASWETVHRRRQLAWNPDFYRTEWSRLEAARREADLILHTDNLSRQEVLDSIVRWWDVRAGLAPVWAQYPRWDGPMKAEIRQKLATGALLSTVVSEVERPGTL